MKYLKLFEGYLDQSQYWEIDDISPYRDRGIIRFPSIEMDRKIVDYLTKLGFAYKNHNNKMYWMDKTIDRRSLKSRLKEKIISIYQLEDDYFIVDDEVYDGSLCISSKYWKCDQFDGLKKLLKEKGFDK